MQLTAAGPGLSQCTCGRQGCVVHRALYPAVLVVCGRCFGAPPHKTPRCRLCYFHGPLAPLRRALPNSWRNRSGTGAPETDWLSPLFYPNTFIKRCLGGAAIAFCLAQSLDSHALYTRSLLKNLFLCLKMKGWWPPPCFPSSPILWENCTSREACERGLAYIPPVITVYVTIWCMW